MRRLLVLAFVAASLPATVAADIGPLPGLMGHWLDGVCAPPNGPPTVTMHEAIDYDETGIFTGGSLDHASPDVCEVFLTGYPIGHTRLPGLSSSVVTGHSVELFCFHSLGGGHSWKLLMRLGFDENSPPIQFGSLAPGDVWRCQLVVDPY